MQKIRNHGFPTQAQISLMKICKPRFSEKKEKQPDKNQTLLLQTNTYEKLSS